MLGWNEQWVVLLRHRCSVTFPPLPDLRLALSGRHAVSPWRQWSSGGGALRFKVSGLRGSREQGKPRSEPAGR